MTREEAIRKLEYSKKAYQMLIDEKVDSGKLVGKDVKGEWKADTPLDEAYKSMIDAISIAIKALERETKWIPVSERLPEDSGRYLAYIVNEHDDKFQYIMTCDYDSSVDSYWHWFPDDESASDNVVAWMPLPKPYKAEGEEV